MTSPQLPGAAGGGQAEPYRSIACRIGTHMCAEGVPRKFSADLPLIYETCQCSCHKPTANPATIDPDPTGPTTQPSRGNL